MKKGARALDRTAQWLDARTHFRQVRLTRTGIALPLRPTPFSPTYYVRIDYERDQLPSVFVLSPPLMNAPKHTYRNDGSLCLYYRTEYDNTMLLSETIIPWAAHWLYCYELWQVQGEWPAPESPHAQPK